MLLSRPLNNWALDQTEFPEFQVHKSQHQAAVRGRLRD
ncbi:hypothetical protein LCGC14_2976990, partial [marine sediment metagenome]